VAKEIEAEPPDVAGRETGAARRLVLRGSWTLSAARLLEQKAQEVVARGLGARSVVIDLSGVARLDTAGAFLLNRARNELAQAGVAATLEGARPEHGMLVERIRFHEAPRARKGANAAFELLADFGEMLAKSVWDFIRFTSFLGEFVSALGRIVRRPQLFRGTSLVYQMENFAIRSIPIIVTINLTVGAIVAQQGIFELLRFGASTYVVDLVGILVLRELGVLLTSIMIAGRSGSAITAEIGSMVVREEIDALRAMGLSPMEVLVAPRVLALVLSLPLLTFVADMAALLGGLLMSWSYGGISPAAFIALLQTAIGLKTFFVGMIKAPFMALVIGLIATQEGLTTRGSAESLGWQVTTSVVKSIFTVIILDGLFAVFFTSINF
jgi:phospholipid/cholesterol/gamma-HCH transport system permease protein